MEHVSVKSDCANMQRYYQINLILLRGKSQGSFWYHILTVVISASFVPGLGYPNFHVCNNLINISMT